jgi:ketosteroid isomerase-like protein
MATAATEPRTSSQDHAALEALNREYIRSVVESDVAWFDRNLAPDFVCITRDGSLLDRAAFLNQTARPIAFSNFELHDVQIRLLGDFALIHARTTYTLANGQPAASRYTDAWARQQDRWLAVSAHITPIR